MKLIQLEREVRIEVYVNLARLGVIHIFKSQKTGLLMANCYDNKKQLLGTKNADDMTEDQLVDWCLKEIFEVTE